MRDTGGFVPIAIIGLGCRFPSAPDVSAYWRMMLDGVDAITEVPSTRWNVDAFYDPRPATPCKVVTRCGGFLEGIDRFDPYFFGIAPREAARMDPQQRLLLEVTWEAMENAGMPRERFAGSHTGVFMGVCTDDYITLERGDLKNIDIYMGTGGSRGSTAGRLAYLYGLTGPTAAVDTACSSSLVAVHQACNALQQGDCDMALAGGVNVVLHPGTAVAFSQANMLSPDGRCKAFDSRADGFVRSEGAGVVLLKPLAQALADDDPVYAVIRASASNNDGSSSPFMTPSRTGQAALLRHAYARAGVAPSSIQYIEAHGTGTAVGDPVEMGALADVLADGRSAGQLCLLGSSKTNIGHTEAAAGIAGLIKAALCLRNRLVPPNLHFVTPNPNIPWARLPFRVPTAVTPWPAGDGPARAAVNSFGISGTNAHVVLEAAPAALQRAGVPGEAPTHEPAGAKRSADILVISAHTPEAMEAAATSYRDLLRRGQLDGELRDLCYSAAIRRTHHEHRMAVVCRSREELTQKLDAFLTGEMPPGVVSGAPSGDGDQRPIFVFSGIGTQWPEMGRHLRDSEPVFRDAFLQCDAAISAITGWSVVAETDRPERDSILDRMDIMQPAIFSVQVGLAALWRSWGVEPAAVIGHSLGEIAAAFVAGALSLDDAARVVCARSSLMHRTSGLGRMLAVGLSPDDAARRIERCEGRVSLAVINGPSSCVLSGDSDAVDEIARTLEADGVFCRLLKVHVACHSHQMDPLTTELATTLAGITARSAAIPLYSTVLAQRVSGTELDAAYWARNLRQSVQFAETMEAALGDGRRMFLEVSPNPVLLTPIRQIAQHRNERFTAVPSLVAGAREREQDVLLESGGVLFSAGCPLQWQKLYPQGDFVAPPPYVWQRERFWFEEATQQMSWPSHPLAMRSHQTRHPLLALRWEPADRAGTHCFETELDVNSMPWLADHRVEGVPLLPAAAYVEMALAASVELFGPGPRTIRNVKLGKALFLPPGQVRRVQLVVAPGNGQSGQVTVLSQASQSTVTFQFHSRDAAPGHGEEHDSHSWLLLASGQIEIASADGAHPTVAIPEFSPDELDAEYPTHNTGEDFYSDVVSGMEFGPFFRSVQRVWGRKKEAVTLIELPPATKADARSFLIHPALLDACFHSLNATSGKSKRLSLPFAIDVLEVRSLPNPLEPHWCEVRLASTGSGYSARVTMFDPRGMCVLRAEGYQTKFLGSGATESDEAKGWLYETHWRKVTRVQQEERGPGGWLLIGAEHDVGAQLSRALQELGHSCTVAPASATREQLLAVLREFATAGTCRGIVHLGALELAEGAPACPASLHCATTHMCSSVLNVLHACSELEWREAPRLFVVTRGAKDLGVAQQTLELTQASLAGLARVAAVELRDFRTTQIDVECATPAHLLAQELLHADQESEVALRGDDRYAARLARLDTTDRATALTIRISNDGAQSYRLEHSATGVLDDLKLRLIPRQPPRAGEVELRVSAVGLNFLDVLKALNMAPGLPAGAEYFGMECSGRIVAVGEGVEGLEVGDEVIALDSTATGCFRAFLTTSATAVFRKPAHLSLEEAATIPIAYQTAYYALCDLGRLRAGESVLIHSAAGGVGMAAVAIARQLGAVIFATAGTEAKREYLKSLGVQYVMNSRTLDFAREVMEYTNGRGVDAVLNSLAGEAIPQSLGVLATGGRFLEIGKRDIYANSQLGLLPFQKNLSFFAVDLLRMRMENPRVVEQLTRDIVERIWDGTFQPLPFTSFPATQVADAFRYMAQGKHMGKIVVTLQEDEVEGEQVPAPVQIRADATYLITGGLGALGLAFARRLVEQGARHLALLGRNAPTAATEEVLRELRSLGARLTVVAADVSDAEQLSRALTEIRRSAPPLKGVLHAAGVIRDGILQKLRWEDFTPVLAPKVLGGWNLHTQLQHDELDFFVLFSSGASVLGGAGQANYAAANSFMDGLAHFRRRAGLTALAVNWGPWAEVGMAAQDNIGERLAERGLASIPVRQGTELLDILMQQRPAQIAVLPIDWKVWAQHAGGGATPPFFSELSSEWEGAAATRSAESDVLRALRACESDVVALELLRGYLRADVAKILRIPQERLNPKVSLIRLGLDSLMAMELNNRISSEFGVRLPAAKLLQGPSLTDLAGWIGAELRAPDVAAILTAGETLPGGDATVDVDQLSDGEVSAMLTEILASEDGTRR